MPYQVLQTIEDIDLGRHGLIEASAGTGKTYTIENLVVRLLREREDVSLEQILLVTFTEKATAELKVRIREKIEREAGVCGLEEKTGRRLRASLEDFEKAAIYTIHGFCHTLLRDFAFEHHSVFESQVVPDAPLYENLLKEQMRRKWPGWYGEDLEGVLQLSGFAEKRGDFLDTVVQVARFLRPGAGDRLFPAVEEEEFGKGKEVLKNLCWELKDLMGTDRSFSEGFGQLNLNARSRSSLLKNIVLPAEAFFSAFQGDLDFQTLGPLLEQIEAAKSGDRKGPRCLTPSSWLKKGPNPEVCPNLEKIQEGLETLIHRFQAMKVALTVKAIHGLREDVSEEKRTRGWISYDDMLDLVDRSLSREQARPLMERIRNRYKVAFIDEFQDTDPVQWRIFRKIFIDQEASDNPNLVFVIGDPKQAIYSFRGADVFTYLSARNEMERLERQGQARRYSLSFNYRSSPSLIHIYNTLFCRGSWFPPHDQAGPYEIGYQETLFPEEARPRITLLEDPSERRALNIVDLSGFASPKRARPRLARFIAREITFLLASSIRLQEGDRERNLECGDICVLVRTRFETPAIEEELRKAGIPFSFYKKPGLFLSEEAAHVSMVFHAILNPGEGAAAKRALLTPFFDLKPFQIQAYGDLPPSHPAKQLLFEWHAHAMARKWPVLFQSLMEDSGLIFRESAKNGWERKYANYRQILEFLVQTAYSKNLDFRGLTTFLDIHARDAAQDLQDEGIHRIETEARKVQIMTLHVSKGLEFPVVFVAGGLTQRSGSMESYRFYHRPASEDPASERVRVVDLAGYQGKALWEAETLEENKRLYYVACTRAQFKLYVPFYRYDRGNMAWLGPVCTLVSPSLAEAFPKDTLHRDVAWLDVDAPDPWVSSSEGDGLGPMEGALPWGEDAAFFPSQEGFGHRKPVLESFSSLHLKIAEPREGADGDMDPGQDEGFLSMQQEPQAPEARAEEMPGGIEVGLLLHEILETLDYGLVLEGHLAREGPLFLLNHTETMERIRSLMALYRVEEKWTEAVCRMAWHTLTAPIPAIGPDFCLACLQQQDRLHEAAFTYAFPALSGEGEVGLHVQTSFIEGLEGLNPGEGFMRGYIDLIFKKDQRYYLADWKSNRLEKGYGRDVLEESMTRANYHLQYKLYAIALLRWLKQARGRAFAWDQDFGGVFYFYLRGMGQGKESGIYHVPPNRLGPLEALEQEVEDLLRRDVPATQ